LPVALSDNLVMLSPVLVRDPDQLPKAQEITEC